MRIREDDDPNLSSQAVSRGKANADVAGPATKLGQRCCWADAENRIAEQAAGVGLPRKWATGPAG